MYRNSERFLTAFNRIEKKMKVMIRNGRNLGFSKMVHILKHKNAIIRRYSDDLLEFAELRNAIVHNKIDMSHAIAEPHDSTVERLEFIEKELLQPRTVSPQFIKDVYILQQDEPLSRLLTLIYKKKVTKFPIYHKGEFKGLISQRAIAFWLSSTMYHSKKMPEEATIEEVLAYETRENYRFISERTSILEAIDIFKRAIGGGDRLEALLITENGSRTEKLMGIITNFDIIGLQHDASKL